MIGKISSAGFTIPHQNVNRRRFLQVGSLAALGSVFSNGIFASGPKITEEGTAIKPITKSGSNSDTSLILIVLQGGLSHFDSFDPREPYVDPIVRGPFKRIETSATKKGGVYLTEALPLLAKQMHNVQVVRNLFHDNSGHDTATSLVFTGSTEKESEFYGESKHPSSLVQYAEHLTNTGSPHIGYVVMHHTEGTLSFGGSRGSGDRNPYAGVGSKHTEALYVPYNFEKGIYVSPFEGTFDRERFRLQKKLLDQIDKSSEELSGVQIDRHRTIRKKAESLLDGPFNEAFNVNEEPETVRDRYGKNPLGNALLIARRMVQKGAKIVVANDGDYDNHSAIKANLENLLGRFDKAISALIEEKEKLGLPVVIAVVSEFGRTPRVNNTVDLDAGGRDHWPNSMSMLLAGEGIEGGTFIGETKDDGTIKGNALQAQHIGETLLNKIGYANFITRNGVLTDKRKPFLNI